MNLRTILCGCHAYCGLEEVVESGNGIEPEFGCQCFQWNVIVRVGQGSDCFVDAEVVDVMSKTGLRMLVDDTRQVGTVCTQKFGHLVFVECLVLINLFFSHGLFQLSEEFQTLFIAAPLSVYQRH